MVKTALTNARIEKKDELSDDEVQKLLKTEIKKRKDSIRAYSEGGRNDLAEKEEQEIVIIQQYLPEELSEEAIRAGIEEVIATLDDTTNFGKVMGAVMAKFEGRADGALVRKILEEKLS
jgi:hypothetical protein